MSQNEQTTTGVVTEQAEAKPTSAKSSWGRTVAMIGVFMTIVGLFMGGLFKDNPTGTLVLRAFFIGGIVCLLVGLAGVGMDALKKRAGKTSA